MYVHQGRKMSLTKKQKQVFDYISEYVDENGYSPTQIEIKEFFGFNPALWHSGITKKNKKITNRTINLKHLKYKSM